MKLKNITYSDPPSPADALIRQVLTQVLRACQHAVGPNANCRHDSLLALAEGLQTELANTPQCVPNRNSDATCVLGTQGCLFPHFEALATTVSATDSTNTQPVDSHAKSTKVVCTQCNDTHRMTLHDDDDEERLVMCTRCPSPCDKCGQGGPYCVKTPCPCDCHIRTGEKTKEQRRAEFLAFAERVGDFPTTVLATSCRHRPDGDGQCQFGTRGCNIDHSADDAENQEGAEKVGSLAAEFDLTAIHKRLRKFGILEDDPVEQVEALIERCQEAEDRVNELEKRQLARR